MAANALEPPESEPDLQGLRVLVVEDSAGVATAVKNLLRSLGADVLGPVATTDAAMRLTAETNPDVALVDLNLRGGELAYDLIDRLHALGVHIVVMSGNDEVPKAMERLTPCSRSRSARRGCSRACARSRWRSRRFLASARPPARVFSPAAPDDP